MKTDFRALCAELLLFAVEAGEIAENEGLWPDCDPDCALIDRTRAALAEPVGDGPSDEELIRLAIDTRLYRFQATAGDPIQYEMTEQQVHAFARAVLSRWGRPAAPPAPEVGELVAALEALADAADQFGPAGGADGRALAAEVEKARGVMARRQSPVPVFPEGAQLSAPAPAEAPIPVAERLPKPDDCDPDGYCWWFDANDGWLRLRCGDGFAWGAITHWLPAHAIPLPQVGEVEG